MIVTLTVNPALDVGMDADLVLADIKIRCRQPHYEPGGGGINVSRAIARLGGDSVALYCAGGATGDMVRGLLEEEGIHNHAVRIEGMTRQSFTVSEVSGGRQYRFILPGAPVREKEWQQVLMNLSILADKLEYVIISGSPAPGIPKAFYSRAARIAADLGALVIVDGSSEALLAALEAGVYLIKPNLRELRQVTGNAVETEEAQEKAAMDLLGSGGSEVVVVSLGAAGALVASREGCERFRAPVVPIRSRVGAGDSMVAGLVLGLSRGLALRDAMHLGIAAGSAAVMTPGTELCRRDDTQRLYDRLKNEEPEYAWSSDQTEP